MRAPHSGIYFFHIPKTAGMTVWRAIESAYSPESICPYWLWDQLIDIPKTELSRCHVFRGHFYGFLEEYLGRVLRKLTILREPVERTISYYHYIRQLPDHPNHRHAQSLGLREFCTNEKTRYLVENYQAGYLASFRYSRDPVELAKSFTEEQKRRYLLQAALEPDLTDIDNKELLDAAQEGLNRFDAVGTVENLEISMEIVSEALGRSLILPQERQNVTPARASASDLDDATLETIYTVTAVDRILYEEAATAVRQRQTSLNPSFAI